jgi:hypothetical protein
MATTAALTENSRQGINFPIPPCTGPKARLSPNPRPGCRHAYDETPVGLVVYVRNDPVNAIDPDGRRTYWLFTGFEGEEGIWNFGWIPYNTLGASGENWGGSGDGGLNFNTNKGWNFWDWGRINDKISMQKRKEMTVSALSAAISRIGMKDCGDFLANILGSLGKLVKENIKTGADLIYKGLMAKETEVYIYGSQLGGQLGKRGWAFGETHENNIYLGELFFDVSHPNGYKTKPGGTQAATLIHESMHLAIISSSGTNLKEEQLNAASKDTGYGSSWADAVRSNCGVVK